MKQFCLPLLLLLFFQTAFSQFSWNSELNLQGMASIEEEELPFWMHNNQRGRIEEETNLLSLLSGKAFYDLGNKGLLEAGAGLLLRDANSDRILTDELYLNYTKAWFELTVGRKQRKELYKGLSASNESILWSLNTRPLPGIQLQTTRPVFILKNFGFEAAWEEYFMNDDRYVDDARLHHKSFQLVYSTADRKFQFKAGIQHFAQWGGNSPVFGEQPEGLKDYLRIVTGKQGAEGSTVSDQLNALGNHLGGYELSVFKSFMNFDLELFYQHLFEDGSGRRLGNTPDGRYGIFVNRKVQDQLINSLMYEFYTTHHQSHTTTGVHKTDDYLNNTGYRSGWTYFQKSIAAPFFTVNPDGLGISNNKFTAHHFSIGGNLSSTIGNHSYRLLLSYAQNDGRRHFRYNPKQDVLYSLFDVKLLQKDIEINLQLAAEYDSYKAPVYGAGVSLKYKIE